MAADYPRWPDKWTREQRQLANKLVAEAKAKGVLKCQPYEVCGRPETIAHHEDYSKPLDVIWLCGRHHSRRPLELDPTIHIRAALTRRANIGPPGNENASGGETGGAKSGATDRPINSSVARLPDNVNRSRRVCAICNEWRTASWK